MLALVSPHERWTVTEEKLRLAVAEIVELAAPARVILFGSRARGDHQPDSDADLLVIEHEVADQAAEMVRLRDALSPLRMPVDLLVVSSEKFEYWSDTPNTIYYEVAREGRLLYDEKS